MLWTLASVCLISHDFCWCMVVLLYNWGIFLWHCPSLTARAPAGQLTTPKATVVAPRKAQPTNSTGAQHQSLWMSKTLFLDVSIQMHYFYFRGGWLHTIRNNLRQYQCETQIGKRMEMLNMNYERTNKQQRREDSAAQFMNGRLIFAKKYVPKVKRGGRVSLKPISKWCIVLFFSFIPYHVNNCHLESFWEQLSMSWRLRIMPAINCGVGST